MLRQIGVLLQTSTSPTDGLIPEHLLSLGITIAQHNAAASYKDTIMLKYAIIFALVSLVAGALGFTGVAAGAAGIAKILFFIFLAIAVIFIVLAVLGVGAARKALK